MLRFSKNLPHILHKKNFITIYNYSKGAQGLSVQPQVVCIFTDISISLKLHWRQQDSRYAIHAGHQLNAKEFRYLWTVRITAAVYWNLILMPQHRHFIYQHRAGVSPYTSSLEFAEACVFIKQSLLSLQCQRFLRRHPFSRSYGANLPSSFNIIILYALVYSTNPPESVFSTV